MNPVDLLSAFLIGVAGTVHCVGMCGGIASAFSFAIPKEANRAVYHLSYNVGRVTSYVMAGAIVGYIGSIAETRISTDIPLLQILSAFFLILMGLYIGQWWMGLANLEKLGGKLWRHISPLSKKFLPFKNPMYAFSYGVIWGWLPCGLVYSALVWSLSSGGVVEGALIMLLFGIGTLPALISIALSAQYMSNLLKSTQTRNIISILLIIAGLYLLFVIFKVTN